MYMEMKSPPKESMKVIEVLKLITECLFLIINNSNCYSERAGKKLDECLTTLNKLIKDQNKTQRKL